MEENEFQIFLKNIFRIFFKKIFSKFFRFFFLSFVEFFLVKQESQLEGARASIQPASVSSPSTSLPALTLSTPVESASTEILTTLVQVGGRLRFYRPVSQNLFVFDSFYQNPSL